MRITRRKLAVMLAASAAAALAQTPTGDPLQAAKDRIKANGDALAKEAVAMSIEPAFQFKA
jgi:hypothetical protein